MMKVAKFALVLSGLAIAVTGAIAADDPVKARQELMKTVGKSMKLSAQMAKGQVDFDAAEAEQAALTIAGVPDKFVTLFPAGSHEGETEASPKIWEDMEGFKASASKMKESATELASAAKQGQDAFASAVGELAKTCKGCHQDYRIKKQ